MLPALNHRARAAVAIAFLAAALGGCASVPSQEMSDARRALDAARAARAAELVPEVMARADGALADASDALRRGDFERARARADAARESAIVARRLAIRIDAVDAELRAARDAGRPWEGAHDLLVHARRVAEEGDVERALAVVDRAEALLR
jgi:hypothetical protein